MYTDYVAEGYFLSSLDQARPCANADGMSAAHDREERRHNTSDAAKYGAPAPDFLLRSLTPPHTVQRGN